MRLKVFSLFAGYGSDHFALNRLGVNYESVGFSEIDKWAILCFENNHGGKNYGDITKINPNDLPDMDLITAGFPCQSFSIAGNMLGELDTRGTLFYEIIRIVEVKQPKYMLLENVKGLTFKKFKPTFDKILTELDRIGYKVYWKVLNSKDYGTPQNRERVWFVCIRKDINQEFNFPKKQELNIVIKDILLSEVDNKYILKQKQVETLVERFNKKHNKSIYETNDSKPEIGQANRIYGVNSFIPPLNCGWSPKIKVPMITNVAPREVGFKTECPTILSRDYRDPKVVLYDAKTLVNNEEMCHTIRSGSGSGNNIYVCASRTRNGQSLEPRYDGCSNSLTTVQKDNYLMTNYTLRKLTPIEFFRLMGFFHDEIKLDGLSDTQRYKLAGNGQDINVVTLILRNLIPIKHMV